MGVDAFNNRLRLTRRVVGASFLLIRKSHVASTILAFFFGQLFKFAEVASRRGCLRGRAFMTSRGRI